MLKLSFASNNRWYVSFCSIICVCLLSFLLVISAYFVSLHLSSETKVFSFSFFWNAFATTYDIASVCFYSFAYVTILDAFRYWCNIRKFLSMFALCNYHSLLKLLQPSLFPYVCCCCRFRCMLFRSCCWLVFSFPLHIASLLTNEYRKVKIIVCAALCFSFDNALFCAVLFSHPYIC